MRTKTEKSNGSDGQMKAGPANQNQLQQLLEDGLKDIYWAEKALTKAIPKMIKQGTAEDLTSALENHLEETQGHVERLEKAFDILGKTPQAKKCEAMAGLIAEADELMEENEKGVMRDAAIILAGQKVEHYEMATYGTLRAFADILGHKEVVSLLEDTLEEEKAADEKLTEVTPSVIHFETAGE